MTMTNTMYTFGSSVINTGMFVIRISDTIKSKLMYHIGSMLLKAGEALVKKSDEIGMQQNYHPATESMFNNCTRRFSLDDLDALDNGAEIVNVDGRDIVMFTEEVCSDEVPEDILNEARAAGENC